MLSRRTVSALILAALAAVGLVTYRASRHQPASAQKTQAAQIRPADQLAAVERVVAERNQHNQDPKVFEADGWTLVSTTPPDPRVTSLDPTLIAEGREAELNLQVGSVSANKSHAHKLAQIVLLAHEAATREHAAIALGHIKSSAAQEEIMGLLTSGKLDPDDVGRRQLAGALRPPDLDDEVAARMADLLAHPALTQSEKEQIAFTLAVVGLRDGMELSQNVQDTMSPETKALVARMTEMASRSFLARGHVHSERNSE